MFSEKIKEIESDQINGASQIARNALCVLKFFVRNSKNKTVRRFREDFREIGKRLFDARPNMAHVQNLVSQIVYEVSSFDGDLFSVKNFAASRIDELCKASKNAVKQCAEQAATLIADDDYLATCSYSSTVYEALKAAKRQGKCFTVFIAESKIDGFSYGQFLADDLKVIGISVEVVPDDRIFWYVPRSKCVLVGADSVLCDSSVINGSPTYAVAVAAKDYGIPFYPVCETIKANILSFLGKDVKPKKGFDLAPGNLVTGIITEKGILDSKMIVEVMKEKSKFFEANMLGFLEDNVKSGGIVHKKGTK